MERIGNVLKDVLKKAGMEKRVNEAQIFFNYRNMVGEKISKISMPTALKNGILFIGVENSIWSHQLYFLKKEIIDRINSCFSQPIIFDIKFHLSKVNEMEGCIKNEVHREPAVSVPDKYYKLVYNISSEIKDKSLRIKFSELMVKDFRFKVRKGKIDVYSHRK